MPDDPTEIDLRDIRSLSDFKRNAKDYVEQLKQSKAPMMLTVNGEATIIVQEAGAFQRVLTRLRELERELERLKAEDLQKELALGLQQLRDGEAVPLDIEAIERLGRERLSRDTK